MRKQDRNRPTRQYANVVPQVRGFNAASASYGKQGIVAAETSGAAFQREDFFMRAPDTKKWRTGVRH